MEQSVYDFLLNHNDAPMQQVCFDGPRATKQGDLQLFQLFNFRKIITKKQKSIDLQVYLEELEKAVAVHQVLSFDGPLSKKKCF